MENSLNAICIDDNIFEPLVVRDADLKINPELALDWSAPDDHSWILELRKGVLFHDGSPLTAEDVKFSLERARSEPASKIQDALAMVDRVEVVNTSRIKITTKQPYSMLLSRLAEVMIVSQKFFSHAHSATDIPPGTGPYKVKAWVPGKKVELTENPQYWGGDPEIHDVVFESVPELKNRIDGLIAGQYDLLPLLEPTALQDQSLKTDRNVRILSTSGLGVIYLGMDLTHDKSPYISGADSNPFRNLQVRQAIYHAINIEHIVKDILKGYAQEATQIVAPEIFGFNHTLKRLTYDPETAKRLLMEAGYPNGFKVRFDFSNNRYRNDDEIGHSIASDLEKIGIQIEPNSMPKEKLFARLNARDTSLYMVGWYLSSGDATSAFDFLVHSRDVSRGYGSENVGGFSDPAVDSLIELSTSMLRPWDRATILKRAMQMTMQDLPYIPLHVESTLVASSNDLRWMPRPDEFIYANQIQFK